LKNIFTNPLFLIFFSIFAGQILGKINFKGIKLGSSGGLFVGIIISYFVTSHFHKNTIDFNGTFVSGELFQFSLIGFIASVGLLASKNIRSIIKNNGLKFIVLALSITFTGALTTFVFAKYFFGELKISIIGTYVGALTSSPGLAAALESAKNIGATSESMVGLGYSISYIPGVVIVILFVQILAKIYKKNIEIKPEIRREKEIKNNETNFCVISFSLVCILGILLGNINIYMGSYLGYFSLGATGGVLITALILGDIKKIGFLKFNIHKNQLTVIRDISLNMFLAIVGLNYGYNAVILVKTSGLQLIIIGSITALLSIIVGYIIGKKILKLNVIYLIGGICGGMTSTPGLAASVEAIESDEVTVGYGATYPFALFFMILFTNILFKI